MATYLPADLLEGWKTAFKTLAGTYSNRSQVQVADDLRKEKESRASGRVTAHLNKITVASFAPRSKNVPFPAKPYRYPIATYTTGINRGVEHSKYGGGILNRVGRLVRKHAPACTPPQSWTNYEFSRLELHACTHPQLSGDNSEAAYFARKRVRLQTDMFLPSAVVVDPSMVMDAQESLLIARRQVIHSREISSNEAPQYPAKRSTFPRVDKFQFMNRKRKNNGELIERDESHKSWTRRLDAELFGERDPLFRLLQSRLIHLDPKLLLQVQFPHEEHNCSRISEYTEPCSPQRASSQGELFPGVPPFGQAAALRLDVSPCKTEIVTVESQDISSGGIGSRPSPKRRASSTSPEKTPMAKRRSLSSSGGSSPSRKASTQEDWPVVDEAPSAKVTYMLDYDISFNSSSSVIFGGSVGDMSPSPSRRQAKKRLSTSTRLDARKRLSFGVVSHKDINRRRTLGTAVAEDCTRDLGAGAKIDRRHTLSLAKVDEDVLEDVPDHFQAPNAESSILQEKERTKMATDPDDAADVAPELQTLLVETSTLGGKEENAEIQSLWSGEIVPQAAEASKSAIGDDENAELARELIMDRRSENGEGSSIEPGTELEHPIEANKTNESATANAPDSSFKSWAWAVQPLGDKNTCVDNANTDPQYSQEHSDSTSDTVRERSTAVALEHSVLLIQDASPTMDTPKLTAGDKVGNRAEDKSTDNSGHLEQGPADTPTVQKSIEGPLRSANRNRKSSSPVKAIQVFTPTRSGFTAINKQSPGFQAPGSTPLAESPVAKTLPVERQARAPSTLKSPAPTQSSARSSAQSPRQPLGERSPNSPAPRSSASPFSEKPASSKKRKAGDENLPDANSSPSLHDRLMKNAKRRRVLRSSSSKADGADKQDPAPSQERMKSLRKRKPAEQDATSATVTTVPAPRRSSRLPTPASGAAAPSSTGTKSRRPAVKKKKVTDKAAEALEAETKANTQRNKQGSVSALAKLKQLQRQKDVGDVSPQKPRGEKGDGKGVTWAEESDLTKVREFTSEEEEEDDDEEEVEVVKPAPKKRGRRAGSAGKTANKTANKTATAAKDGERDGGDSEDELSLPEPGQGVASTASPVKAKAKKTVASRKSGLPKAKASSGSKSGSNAVAAAASRRTGAKETKKAAPASLASAPRRRGRSAAS